jgi:hypothetical protein
MYAVLAWTTDCKRRNEDRQGRLAGARLVKFVGDKRVRVPARGTNFVRGSRLGGGKWLVAVATALRAVV